MFAATTVDSLCITDPTTLKKPPPSLPPTVQLPETPTATAWSTDNLYLYFASANSIFRYDPESNDFEEIYSVAAYERIQHIVVRDPDTLVFATADIVHVLDITSTPVISQTFDTHKDTITSISLSNDGTLLASTSASSVHVHKFSDGTMTILQGIAVADDIQVSSFHLHLPTKLLVGAGRDLMVYDVAKRTAPLKTIMLSDSAIGMIVAVACSPFSKSLVAVATSGGSIALIDLEKEKSLFRTLMVRTPLTTIGFSPEGAAIYLGTINGKLLIVDLRALDKPPKAVVISQEGKRIETISVQRKIKSATDPSTKTPLTTTTKLNKKASVEVMPPAKKGTGGTTVFSATKSKVASSPVRSRAVKPVVGSPAPPRRVVAATKPAPNAATKKSTSPLRNMNDSDDTPSKHHSDTPNGTPTRPSMKSTAASRSPPSSLRPMSAANRARKVTPTAVTTENPRRARTLPSTNTSNPKASSSPKQPSSISSATSRQPTSRTRAASSSSRAGTEAVSAASSSKTGSKTATTTSSRPTSSASRPGSSISQAGKLRRGSSPVPPIPSIPKSSRGADASPALSFEVPEIPYVRPSTPQENEKRAMFGLNVLGLGTPEVEKWIRAGSDERVKGKGKSVGFKEGNETEDEGDISFDDEATPAHEMALQVSPMRGRATSGAGMSNLNAAAESWASSPGLAAAGTTSSAHELLRTIVQDVMCDFQQETKAEMMGLHLDLLNVGRTWKSELRSLMQEYVGDLKELRDENAQLREENARLRRGTF